MNVRKITDNETTPPSVSQFQGAIIGCALGDAIGAWAERKDPSECRDYVKNFVSRFDFSNQETTHEKYPFGQYTDDTQLTRELCMSIIDNGGFDPEDYANRVANIFAHNAIVGYGGATQEAAVRLIDGVPWNEAGTPPPRAGNGAAMRASPIGLLHWNTIDQLLKDAKDQAIITHTAPAAVAGAVAVAAATGMALNASPQTSHPGELGWWNWLARFVDRVDESYGDDIRHMADVVFTSKKTDPSSRAYYDEVLKWILNKDDDSWTGVSPFAQTSVLWALFSVMDTPKDFWKTMCTAIEVGGDVDTIAAMACAISGAYNGMEGIPDKAIETVGAKLQDTKNTVWDLDGLMKLAERLHDVATQDTEGGEETVEPELVVVE
jgi:ADP-ribosylglycohydrolase